MSELAGVDIERALAEGADPATRVQTLEWIWERVLRHFGPDADVRGLTFDAVLAYVGARRRAGAKGQTIRREVQAMRRGMIVAERRGWAVAPREWPRIKSDPPDERQRGKLVHPDAVKLVLGELDGDARDEVAFAVLTGLRRAEIKRLEASWVEPLPSGSAVPAVLRLPAASTKTRKERIVGLSAPALEIVRRRARAQTAPGPIFSAEDHKVALRRAAVRAGVQRVTLRDLRHTFATLALHRTADPVAVQAALGHTDLRTTQRYLSSTVERTALASSGVLAALDLGSEGSPGGGHRGGENSMGARSSCGQSTGLLSRRTSAVACACCAQWCSVVHANAHTCTAQGAPVGGPGAEVIRPRRFAFAGGAA